jgi:acyl-coenzyme A synthetase/AMP-(fatty) acid ligase
MPRAYVVLKAHAKGEVEASAVEHWFAERVIKYKRLRGGVAFVDEVPKSASGKIQRKVIREWAEHYQEGQKRRPKL